jgi:hypothetical protein
MRVIARSTAGEPFGRMPGSDRPCRNHFNFSGYQEDGSWGSAVVSLTISHRSLQHSWRSSLATVCLNTTMLLGTKVTTNSEPSGTMETWRRGGSTCNRDNSSSSNADIHATSKEMKGRPNDLFESRSAETNLSINDERVTFSRVC